MAFVLASTGCIAATQSTSGSRAAVAELSPALASRAGATPQIDIISPAPYEQVRSPFRIVANVSHYQLSPSGASVDGEGHLHLSVDGCAEPGSVISPEAIHVGSGASEFEVELEPGTHTLCIQLGDGFHTAVDISTTIRVTVAR